MSIRRSAIVKVIGILAEFCSGPNRLDMIIADIATLIPRLRKLNISRLLFCLSFVPLIR